MSDKLVFEAKCFSFSLFWFGLGFFPALPDSLGEMQMVGTGKDHQFFGPLMGMMGTRNLA